MPRPCCANMRDDAIPNLEENLDANKWTVHETSHPNMYTTYKQHTNRDANSRNDAIRYDLPGA